LEVLLLSNIFTPPGTSLRNQQVQNQSNAAGWSSVLGPGEAAYQGQLQNFRNAQLPNMEQGVQNAYYGTTQGGRNAAVDAYGAQALAQANDAAGLADSQFAGNPSLAQGAKIDASNQANQTTDAYAGQVNSPQDENAAWGQYMNANAGLSPNYSGLAQLQSGAYSQPQVPVGQGLGGFLGSALGTWAGAGYPELGATLGGMFGAGSVNPVAYGGL
jgi:hypothetical protein